MWLHVIEEFFLVNDSPSNPYRTFCRPELAAVGNLLSIITEMNFNSTLLLKVTIKKKKNPKHKDVMHSVCVRVFVVLYLAVLSCRLALLPEKSLVTDVRLIPGS